jgi:aldehyde:ferredoxin oxidoreductase
MITKHDKDTGRGFWGRVCHVDLGSGSILFEELGPDLYQKYLGGVGLGARILWDRIKPGVDPMGPENVLGFTTGLLTDTGSLFTGRFMVVGKSPMSGGWGEANCGGYFSPFLKRCRIDALFVSGIADRPVYLFIDHQSAELKDAKDLWGKDTIETENLLHERHGKSAQVACIGPAGERCSYLAAISTDGGRMAARSGMGAVMGSKKLKAVVVAGGAKVAVADREKMKQLSEDFRKRLRSFAFVEPWLSDQLLALVGKITGKPLFIRQPAALWRWLLRKFGTPSLTAISAETGDSPVKNWGGSVATDFPGEQYGKVAGEQIARYETKKYGCYSCPIRCGGTVSVTDGPYRIDTMHKPEYETICSFGALLCNDDLHSVFLLNDLVNRGGIDSISCGGVLAFALECYDRGIIDQQDTGGLDLRWGNSDAIVALTKMIISREGLGDLLADGVKLAAERIGRGSDKFAMHYGGVEPAMHDARFDPGLGITYYCEPAPGRHTGSCMQFLEVQSLEKQFTRAKTPPLFTTRRGKYRLDDKAEAIAVGMFYKMLVDAAGACLFGTQVGGNLPLCEWMNAATGWDLSHDEYLVIGERIGQLRRAFTLREGINPVRDFRPNPRLYGDPPLQSGPLKGVTVDIDALAASYHRVMGLDPVTGRPELARLRELGMEEVAEGLYGGGDPMRTR